jgi:addiction module HigA family antidote
MSNLFNPPHPGETLREDVLPALDLNVTAAADALGVTRAALSRVLHGHAGISPEMALKLEQFLGADHGGSAAAWMAQQAAFDLWQTRKAAATRIKKVKRFAVPDREHAMAHK